MAMFSEKRVNRKWRRVFRTLYAILGFSFLITFFPVGEEAEIFFLFSGAIAGLAGLVFLAFLYNNPEKLKMQDEHDFFNNN